MDDSPVSLPEDDNKHAETIILGMAGRPCQCSVKLPYSINGCYPEFYSSALVTSKYLATYFTHPELILIDLYICSAQTRKSRNLRIALRKVGIYGIRTLARNPRIAQFFAQSWNTLRKPCIAQIRSYKVRILI